MWPYYLQVSMYYRIKYWKNLWSNKLSILHDEWFRTVYLQHLYKQHFSTFHYPLKIYITIFYMGYDERWIQKIYLCLLLTNGFLFLKFLRHKILYCNKKNDRFCTYRMHKICINLRKYNDVPMSNSIYFMFGWSNL